jgi:uncharacterized protein (TIGR03435 family)
MMRGIAIALLAYCGAFGQVFEVARVKASASIVGHDGNVTTEPGRLTVRNATLKRLIFEAYAVPYSRIAGGPGWLDSDEFDIDARAAGAAGPDELRRMLRALLTERFGLAVHTETKEGRVYALVVARGGAKLAAAGGADDARQWRFHGDLSQFADRLATALTIPMAEADDPTVPSRASGTPVPVVNETGIAGVFDIRVDLRPEGAGDTFTIWQRALQEQLGLRLEARRAPVETLVVDRAERVPQEN